MMMSDIDQSQNKFCFCTLALGQRYRLMARDLANDLDNYVPGIKIIIFTDAPKDVQGSPNVVAYKHKQQSTLRCVNDKRFVLEKALLSYPAVIFIDADTKILAPMPNVSQWPAGITALSKKLIDHIQRYNPQYMSPLRTVASKLDISESCFENAEWIGESMYIITRDEGKEKAFLATWGKLVNYMELRKLHPNEGYLMGLAAAKVGWKVYRQGWPELSQIRQHLDASFHQPPTTFWESWKMRVGYHYRFNRSRIRALRHFDFYYR